MLILLSDAWHESYQPLKTPGGAQSLFLTEVSTAAPPTTTAKKSAGKTALPSLIQNYNSTVQLQKNLLFPSIKKSQSLLNLRAMVSS